MKEELMWACFRGSRLRISAHIFLIKKNPAAKIFFSAVTVWKWSWKLKKINRCMCYVITLKVKDTALL